MAVGDKESCGVTGAGELFCWGDELGPTPTQVGTETDWTHVSVSNVAASGARKCGLRAPGTLHCWGPGPIGGGTIQEAPAPVQIGSETTWTSVPGRPFGSGAVQQAVKFRYAQETTPPHRRARRGAGSPKIDRTTKELEPPPMAQPFELGSVPSVTEHTTDRLIVPARADQIRDAR